MSKFLLRLTKNDMNSRETILGRGFRIDNNDSMVCNRFMLRNA
jgi:hypothetical protein